MAQAYRTAVDHMPELKTGASMRVAPSHLKAYVKLANILKEEKEDYPEAVKVSY